MAKIAGCPHRAAALALCRHMGRLRIRAVGITGGTLGLAAGSTLRLLHGPHCWATGPLMIASAANLVAALATHLRAAEPWSTDERAHPHDGAKSLLLAGSQAAFALGGAAAAQFLFDLVEALRDPGAARAAAVAASACLGASFLGLYLSERAVGRETDTSGLRIPVPKYEADTSSVPETHRRGPEPLSDARPGVGGPTAFT